MYPECLLSRNITPRALSKGTCPVKTEPRTFRETFIEPLEKPL